MVTPVTAFVLVDAQQGLLDGEDAIPDTAGVIERLVKLLAAARAAGTLIIHLQNDIDPYEACLELARRYLHIFGPATPEAFARWAGIRAPRAIAAFETLGTSLTLVRTPIGDAWILSQDEPLFRASPGPAAPARLLPSGDTWFLLQGADRELLVPDEHHRRALWTPRVWPGALLVEGETVGTWRRAEHVLTIQPWGRLSSAQRDAVEAEASSLPLPGINRPMDVRWDQG
jgi:hypothetical protein